VATPSAELTQENVRYDLGCGTEQMTFGSIIRLATCWELARPTAHSMLGGGVKFDFTCCKEVVVTVAELPELFQLKRLSPALEARPHLNGNNPSIPRI
jgi:hypothetical protein